MSLEKIHEDRLTRIYLKQIDDTNTTVEEDNDDWETPNKLYNFLIQTYQIFPKLDAFATYENRKCLDFISKKENAFFTEWLLKGKAVDIWANPPGTLQLDAIARAEAQFLKHGMKIMMILPTRVMGTKIWDRYIEDDFHRKREYHKITGRPSFLKNGRKVGNSAQHAYVVVIWRKI